MNYNKIMKRLTVLDIEDIVALREAHKNDHEFWMLCNNVIHDKNSIIREAQMEGYIDELLAKKNAPDGAGTPSQGKQPINPHKVRLRLHCSRFRRKGKDMEREKIIKIKEEELDNQPMASQRAIEARDALDDALEEYIVAVQEDAFYLGYMTAMKRCNKQEG